MPLVGVICAEAAGEESPWKVLPMFGGGYVQNVIQCPSNPDRFYSYVDVGGPYRSDDRCRTWIPIHANMPVDMRQRGMGQIRSLSVDPRDADSIVIASGGTAVRAGGLAVSRDAGRTWKVTAKACFYGNCHARMTGCVLDRNPFNPDELVAGEDWSGIFVSRDNGETWRSCKKFNDDIPNQYIYAGADFLVLILRNQIKRVAGYQTFCSGFSVSWNGGSHP
jgi:hypothetical protein